MITENKVTQSSEFLHNAAVRLSSYKGFLSKEAWADFEDYDGPIVSGNPEGNLPDDFPNDDV